MTAYPSNHSVTELGFSIPVWKGSVIVGNESMPSETYHTLVLSANESETGVKMTSGDDDTEFILVRFGLTI